MAKAVFLDRDETLNPDSGYISDPDKFELYPWVGTELARLKAAGFLLILVSNQSGVERGLITLSQLEQIHQKLNFLLKSQFGVTLDYFAICTHRPDQDCECRKPKPKLILDAASRFKINLTKSFMIGDRPSDYEAGVRAGVKKSFQIAPGDRTQFTQAIEEILKSEAS
jgi:D,D-heptose 1,7-bisphosphate phosphatase